MTASTSSSPLPEELLEPPPPSASVAGSVGCGVPWAPSTEPVGVALGVAVGVALGVAVGVGVGSGGVVGGGVGTGGAVTVSVAGSCTHTSDASAWATRSAVGCVGCAWQA